MFLMMGNSVPTVKITIVNYVNLIVRFALAVEVDMGLRIMVQRYSAKNVKITYTA